jgi:uncharacterized RDD family membrane protein YckC
VTAPIAAEVETPEPVYYQPSLFRDPATPKVIPIPTLTPLNPGRRAGALGEPARTTKHRSRRSIRGQQALELREHVEARPEDSKHCDAPVALPSRRLRAAAVDAGLTLAGAGVAFLGTALWYAGEIALSRSSLLAVLGLMAVVAVLYRTLWALAGGDTPGMRAAGIQLLDFDGRRPNRTQRVIRQLAGALSFVAAGLGLAWVLVDDEKLAWHDHISKTFPTPV